MPKVCIEPGRLDIVVFRTGSFPATMTLNQINEDGSLGPLLDLTGFTASLLIYSGRNTVYDTLTDGNGRLTLGGTAGTVAFELSEAQIAAYPFARVSWSLTITDDTGLASPILAGDFIIETELPTNER